MLSLAAATTTGQAVAAPGAGAGAISGDGVVTPGLFVWPTAESGYLSGSGVVVNLPGGPVATACCFFQFNSVDDETIFVGGGIASGFCGISGSPSVVITGGTVKNCNVVYTRVGLEVTVSGWCGIDGNAANVADELVFLPINATGTGFALAGAIVIGQYT